MLGITWYINRMKEERAHIHVGVNKTLRLFIYLMGVIKDYFFKDSWTLLISSYIYIYIYI
jgi:hypothetical protein